MIIKMSNITIIVTEKSMNLERYVVSIEDNNSCKRKNIFNSYTSAINNYSMRVHVSYVDDMYEENDAYSTAEDITEGDYPDLVCMDLDLFNVTLTADT